MATEAARLRVDARIDVVREVCPMTYVRTKLALESLAVGQRLEVRLTGEEPLRNVPRSAQEEGHEVESLTPAGDDGTWSLVIRKGRDAF
ncbi:MAG: sulfurtransferase TusA family protein [Myxococcaceae bacterium]